MDAENRTNSEAALITHVMLRDKTQTSEGLLVLPHCPLNPVLPRPETPMVAFTKLIYLARFVNFDS